MTAILRAVHDSGLIGTIIYPNSDRGHRGIIEAINAFRRGRHGSRFEVVRSLDRDTYLRRLIEAGVIVGNSSSGIIEAASAGTTSVNIGIRQAGRERAGRSIVDADETYVSIRTALEAARRKRPITGTRTAYGDGLAGNRIAEILDSTPLSDHLLRKIAGTP
jgi:UDP-N-acetylglucosamine 2-epimerase